MRVGAVVVIYNNPREQVERCLSSLKQSKVVVVEVVDNSPPSENLGFAAAANQGAAKLETDIIFFVNPDAYVKPGALQSAQSVLIDNPVVGIVGMSLRTEDGDREPAAYGQAVTPLSLFTRHMSPQYINSEPLEVGWVSGGGMLVRRQTFQALSGFDENFFLYWEDVDLCRRAWEAGWSVMHDPNAHVVHERGASHASGQEKTKHYDTSAGIYFQKHYAKPIWITLLLVRQLYRRFWPQAQ